jgi:hypothetical protein
MIRKRRQASNFTLENRDINRVLAGVQLQILDVEKKMKRKNFEGVAQARAELSEAKDRRDQIKIALLKKENEESLNNLKIFNINISNDFIEKSIIMSSAKEDTIKLLFNKKKERP